MSTWKLKVENVGGLEGSHNFEFEEGLNVIHAPNASGKTSLLNALRLVIPREDDNLDNRVTDGKSRAEITLENGLTHQVTLNRSKDGVSYGTKKIQFDDPKVRDLAFLMEDSPLMEAIREANPDGIAEWFRSVTDIQYYEQARDMVSELLTTYQTKKENRERQLSGNKAEVRKDLHETQERLEEVTEELEEVENKPEVKEVREKLADLEDREDDVLAELQEVRSEIKERENDVEDWDRHLNNKEQELEEAQSELDDLQQERKNLESRISEMETEKDELRHEIEKLEVRLEEKNDALRRIEEDIQNFQELKGEDECPTCLRPLEGVDVGGVLEEKRGERDDFKDAVESIDDEIEELVSERREIQERIEYFNTELSEEIEAKREEVKSIKSGISGIKGKIDKAEDELSSLKPTREDLQEELEEIRSELRDVDIENEELKQKMNSLRSERNKLVDREQELEQRLHELERGSLEVRRLERKIELTDEILKHFSERVDMINEKVRSEINQELKENFELLELADFQEIGIVRDTFDINLVRANGERTNLGELSGAEKRLVALIIMAVTKKSFYPEFPFLVVDEVTNSMDDTRFGDILEWVSDELPMVLVTRNAPFQEKEILQQKHIKHDIAALA